MPNGMISPGPQSTIVENSSAERFGSGEEVQNLVATGVGADYPVPFSTGENEAWQRDPQSQREWIPGFGKMVSPLILRRRVNFIHLYDCRIP